MYAGADESVPELSDGKPIPWTPGESSILQPPCAFAWMSVCTRSHIPEESSNQQRSIDLIAKIERDFTTLMTNLPSGNVPDKFQDVCYGMLVADGMGGTEGGDIASRLAVSTLVNYALGTPDWIMRTGTWESEKLLERIAERYARSMPS